jgi:small subunit ribosomal protein S6
MTASTSPAAAGVQESRAREYETIYILRSDVAPDNASRLATRVREIIESRDGKLLKVDNWGHRRLAYPIGKATRGVFVYLGYVGEGGLVAELERNLRLLDDVVRYQTVVTKRGVHLTDYQVDEADLEFRALEVVEEEAEPELAQRLGLLERPRYSAPDDSEVDDIDDGDDDEEIRGRHRGASDDDEAAS